MALNENSLGKSLTNVFARTSRKENPAAAAKGSLEVDLNLIRPPASNPRGPSKRVLASIDSTLSTIRMTIAFKTVFKLVPLPNFACIPHAIFNLVITISWLTTMPQTRARVWNQAVNAGSHL